MHFIRIILILIKISILYKVKGCDDMILLKRISIFLGLVLFSVLVVSCSKEEKTSYETLQEKFSQNYPNGYDIGYEWYEFKDESIEENSEGKKTIRTIDFIGYIDFGKNSTEGIVTKFMYNVEIITIKEGQIIKHIASSYYLNDGNYYEVSETTSTDMPTSTRVSKGCTNAEYFSVELMFNNDLFYVDLYHSNAFLGYDSISVIDDHVTLDRSYSNDSHSYSEKSGYFYDENYNITKMFLYKNKTYDMPLNEFSRNESTTRFLMLSEEVEINVPTEYDEEYVYEVENAVIGW